MLLSIENMWLTNIAMLVSDKKISIPTWNWTYINRYFNIGILHVLFVYSFVSK